MSQTIRRRPPTVSDVAYASSLSPQSAVITDLDEMLGWLGANRERLRLANPDDNGPIAQQVRQWKGAFNNAGRSCLRTV